MGGDYCLNAINPKDPTGPRIKVILPTMIYEHCFKYESVKYENLRAAKCVLENPQRIFFGIRELNPGGWCYTGRPKRWFIRENVQVPFPTDRVFAVYLNARMHVYEWRAEYTDQDDPMCPKDWQNRYEELKWKSTS